MQSNFLSPVLSILVFILILLSIVAIGYLYISAKSRERLALIEKGMDPNLARSDFWLQIGIIGGGIALGLIADSVLGLGYGPLTAMLVAGAGLVVYNLIRRSRMQKNSRV